MKSNKYWEDRANLRMSTYHKNSDETIGKINNAYDKAIEEINKDINRVFYTFQSESGLSIAEAKELLNSNIPKKEFESIRSKINGIEDEELKRSLMAELNAKAYKARITRLEAIKESIRINSAKVADVQLKQGELSYINGINDAYYKTIYDIQKGVGLGFDFSPMPINKVEEIIKNNWSGKHYSERVWGNTEVLASKLEETIKSGLMSGKSSRKMAKELEELGNYGKMASERLVRTETTYIANEAELESYKECDIDKYVFVATLDLRTSSMCREMDGKIIEVSKGTAGENLPPLHPWCRSTTIAYMGKEWYKNIRRRARDSETGKTYTVQGDMKYDEWYKCNVVSKYGEQKAETFQKMIRNKASDIKQYEKFKEILGENVPKSFDKFRHVKYNDSEEWNELKSRFRVEEYNNNNKDAKVEWDKINTAEYKGKFKGIGNNKVVDNNICKYTKQILQHRENTLYEDLYVIDKETGKIIAFETGSKIPKQINFSDDTIEKITGYKGKLILVHNHPKSSTFSPADINLLTNAESIDTIIACGHDGGVHIASGLKEKFKINTRFTEEARHYKKLGFTEDTAREKAWETLSDIYKFIYERR